jgi:hypothetical protein
MTDFEDVSRALKRLTKVERAPYLFVGGVCLGGLEEL